MTMNTIWAEKYRPMEFSNLVYNTDIERRMKRMLQSEDFPHLLFYGPNGAGKRSLIKCVLNEIYGPGAHKMKSELKEFKATQSTSVECVVYSSNYHLEVSPSESDRYDRVIVNTLIKEMAGSARLDVVDGKQHTWKVIVIHDLDKLSREAQSGLRRTMEKYMHNCRIIFNCESLSKVLPPLKSRCVQIRVPGPKREDIYNTLQSIAKYEDFTLHDEVAYKIADDSNRNMRKAIMQLQLLKNDNKTIPTKVKLVTPGYEGTVQEICKMTLNEQTPKQLRNIRTKFYDLLVKGISADVIINLMAKIFLKSIDNFIKLPMMEQAVQCDFRCQLGQKEIIHLEAFAAIVMMIVRKHMS